MKDMRTIEEHHNSKDTHSSNRSLSTEAIVEAHHILKDIHSYIYYHNIGGHHILKDTHSLLSNQ